MNTNKSRILKLLSYLYHYTDEEHPITTEEIIEKYSSDGEVLNRKTVYADIQALADEGWDIRKTVQRILHGDAGVHAGGAQASGGCGLCRTVYRPEDNPLPD